MKKLDNLIDWFGNKNSVMVSLSGGVDSALVAYAAFEKLGNSAYAVTADYSTLSNEEISTAKSICSEIGIQQLFLKYNELENEEFVKNTPNRCFHCRLELGTHLINLAKKYHVNTIVDGTHVDDLGDYRPGIEAIKQNGIDSPLVDVNFSKSEIRQAAKLVGLSVHKKPSNSCLASRIPWGQRVTAEKLTRIELAETIVKQITQVKQVRVRDFDGLAKIEVEKDMIKTFTDKTLKQITEKLQMIGFVKVVLDQDGYKPGKINVIAD